MISQVVGQVKNPSPHLQTIILDFVWSQQSGIEKGEKGEQSNREYSSKVLASKELHYICMHWYQME